MPGNRVANRTVKVAFVSRDDKIRLRAARAFDVAPPHWDVQLHDLPPHDADVVVVGSDVPGVAGIPFDESAPHKTLEAIARTTSNPNDHRVVVVTSASRGTGVTSVALHVAQSLATAHGTCYLDLDLEWGAADRLGLPGEVRRWADDPSPRQASIPVQGRFRVLLAPPSAALVPKLLNAARREFERLVVDLPAGSLQQECLASCDAATLVIPPTVPGAQRARRFLDKWPEQTWALVLNRIGPGGETTAREIEAIMGRKLALELPCSRSLRDCEDECRLLTGFSRWRRRIDALASAIEAA